MYNIKCCCCSTYKTHKLEQNCTTVVTNDDCYTGAIYISARLCLLPFTDEHLKNVRGELYVR